MIFQKLIGLSMLAVSAFCFSNGEATFATISILVGTYLLFTKRKYTM